MQNGIVFFFFRYTNHYILLLYFFVQICWWTYMIDFLRERLFRLKTIDVFINSLKTLELSYSECLVTKYLTFFDIFRIKHIGFSPFSKACTTWIF